MNKFYLNIDVKIKTNNEVATNNAIVHNFGHNFLEEIKNLADA
jgi:hypothetical protein